MAKVACLKDFYEYAVMIAALCECGGHTAFKSQHPVDFEAVIDFGPDLVVLGLFRKRSAYNRPLVNLEEDVLGLATARDIESYPAIRVKPILLLGNGIEAREVPDWFHYDLFLFFPDDLPLFLPKVEELATRVKTRRTLSCYICPHCGSRLTYVHNAAKELFCPRCHTAVSLIPEENRCLYTIGSTGDTRHCTLVEITPRKGESSADIQRRAEGH